MSLLQSPRPWWVAAALSAPLLVLLDHALGDRVPLPSSWRLALLLAALLAVPTLLARAGLRRQAPPAAAPSEVAQAAADVAQARLALQAAMADLARADRAATAAPEGASRAGRGTAFLAWGLVFFLVVSGGLAYAFLQVPGENVPSSTNPLHYHATFAVFVRGERINYSTAPFDLNQRGFLVSHLHNPDQDVLHLEGQRGQRFSDALARATGTHYDAGSIALDVPVPLRHDAAGEEKVQLYVAHHAGDDWAEVADLQGYVPLDQDRILLTLGALDEAALKAEQGVVRVGSGT
jgi:hypothetical protein